MLESPAPTTLQELVTAFEKSGRTALGELSQHPALIQCDGAGSQKAWGFDTVAVSSPWDLKVALGLAQSGLKADPEILVKAGAVYPVAKRPGGPFPDRIGVGRARTADISLRLSSVSKYHAYFAIDEAKRAWSVWDARSRNGTTVGQRKLEAGEGAAIENGASILFGEGLFLFFTRDGFLSLVKGLAAS
ncbi:MAG: FHA domain-containing protein [Myxococcales bacterium]